MLRLIIVCFAVFVDGSISEEYTLTDSSLPSVLPVPKRIDFEIDFENVKKIHRFWTNTGLCPPAPTNDSSTLADFFLSEKFLRNLEYISALPNNGLKYVRIHWLINLIQFM